LPTNWETCKDLGCIICRIHFQICRKDVRKIREKFSHFRIWESLENKYGEAAVALSPAEIGKGRQGQVGMTSLCDHRCGSRQSPHYKPKCSQNELLSEKVEERNAQKLRKQPGFLA
jgi:hypothetical protein